MLTDPNSRRVCRRAIRRESHYVGMIGDGVNDAPAQADVWARIRAREEMLLISPHVLIRSFFLILIW